MLQMLFRSCYDLAHRRCFPSGAGMSGLIFALALHKLSPDIEFHVYEGAHELSEVGAGIAMQQRAWSIMQSIGLDGVLMHATGTDDRGCG